LCIPKEEPVPTIGPFELIIVLVVVLIVFGVGRLPEVGGALGRSIREFRDAAGSEEKAAKRIENQETSKDLNV
jgi:sec-independent protein translocase protein TatA